MRSRADGMALPAVLLLLALMAAMMSAAFLPVLFERRIATNGLKVRQAFSAAESGAAGIIRRWGGADSLPIGGRQQFDGVVETGWYRGETRRLRADLFLITSEGFSRDSAARQRVGLLVVPGDSSGPPRRLPVRGWVNMY